MEKEIMTKESGKFETIEKYKRKIFKITNIDKLPEELKAIDNILFGLLQLGLLDNNDNYKNILYKLEQKQIKLLKEMREDYEEIMELTKGLHKNYTESWQLDNVILDIQFTSRRINEHNSKIFQIEEIENILQKCNNNNNEEIRLSIKDAKNFVLGITKHLIFRGSNDTKVVFEKDFKDLKFTKITCEQTKEERISK